MPSSVLCMRCQGLQILMEPPDDLVKPRGILLFASGNEDREV